MRLVHLSDTHLGYPGHGLQRRVEDPRRPGLLIQQQEADLLARLEEAIDRIIQRVRPDLVIHSGDVFDSARPSAYTLDFAMAQFKRLSQAKIPVVIVEGAHSTPRDRGHGHSLRLLAHLPGVEVIVDAPAQVDVGGIALHCFPYLALMHGSAPERGSRPAGRPNVLVAHGVADGLDLYRTGRSAPPVIVAACAPWYDYVALGHCHRFEQVPHTDRAFYAGSTAMVTAGDFRPGHGFGFNVVTLGGPQPLVERETLTTRPMHAYGLDDATGMSPADVLALLARQAEEVPPEDASCQVLVERLDPQVRRELSIRSVRDIFASSAVLNVRLHVREQHWEAVRAGLLEGGTPTTRFAQLVTQLAGDDTFKADVLAFGRGVLAQAAEEVGAEDVAP